MRVADVGTPAAGGILEHAGVVVTPGVGFGRCGEGYFRVSAFNTPENIVEVVRRFEALGAGLVATSA